MSYLCEECGAVVDFLDYEHTRFGFFGVCPECKGYGIEEADVCGICGKSIALSQIEYGICPECRNDTLKKFRIMLHMNFSEQEIEFLAESEEAF